MGISTNVYTYYGIKVERYDEAFSKAYDEKYDDPQCPNVLFDGIDAEYMILGKCLFDSGDFRWDMEDGDDLQEIDLAQLPKYEIEYKEKFRKFFPEFAHLVDKPFKIMTFTHYS